MSGGKGGSTTSTVEVPQYIEDAARRNLERADLISKIGYVPYFGPDVAAFTPQQEAAFAGTQQLAGAFGTPTAANIGVGAPQTFAGGVRGTSHSLRSSISSPNHGLLRIGSNQIKSRPSENRLKSNHGLLRIGSNQIKSRPPENGLKSNHDLIFSQPCRQPRK